MNARFPVFALDAAVPSTGADADASLTGVAFKLGSDGSGVCVMG